MSVGVTVCAPPAVCESLMVINTSTREPLKSRRWPVPESGTPLFDWPASAI